MNSAQAGSGPDVARMVKEFSAKFFPTNEALAAWRMQAGAGKSELVYE